MRKFLTLTLGVVLGIGGLTMADHDGPAKSRGGMLSEKVIAEKIDGKESKVVTLELTLAPGQTGSPHRHPGPVFGYILEGEYEWAINDEPAKTLKVGDTFYEPTMSLHRVSRNPSEKNKTRFLAVMLVPRDAKRLSIPEKKH